MYAEHHAANGASITVACMVERQSFGMIYRTPDTTRAIGSDQLFVGDAHGQIQVSVGFDGAPGVAMTWDEA